MIVTLVNVFTFPGNPALLIGIDFYFLVYRRELPQSCLLTVQTHYHLQIFEVK